METSSQGSKGLLLEKERIRKEKVLGRKNIPQEDRRLYEQALLMKISGSRVYKNAGSIMSYMAFRGEADLTPLHLLAKSQGKQVLFPYCVSDTKILALDPSDSHSWEPGRYGIMTPDPARSQVVAPDQIDLVLCPCSAFDENGGRLGMGAGYYDRFLGSCQNAVIAAVAFEVQKVSEVPRASWDLLMDMIFTEKEIYPRLNPAMGPAHGFPL